MTINEWGVFVERPDNSTYEIILSEELASQVYEYIQTIEDNDDRVLSKDTEGKILW